jgi:hypothetical protein
MKAAREDLGEAIARRQDEAEDDEGEEPRAFAQGRPADEVIDEPPGDQRADGDGDGLPLTERHDGGIDEVDIGVEIVLDDENQEARDPGEIGLPLEPDQMLGELRRRREILLHMVEAAAVDLPGLAGDACRKTLALPQREIQGNEIEGRADPGDAGDHVAPAQEHVRPVGTGERRGEIPGKAEGQEDDGERPGDLGQGIAHLMANKEMPQRHTADDDEADEQPGLTMIGQHGVVVAHHHQEYGERQIGVVEGPLLADDAELGIRRLTGDEGGGDLPLIGDDDHEDVGRHQRADEDAHMNERAPS